MYIPSFADSTTGSHQRKQVIADFMKQIYPPEKIRADFSIYIAKKTVFCYNIGKKGVSIMLQASPQLASEYLEIALKYDTLDEFLRGMSGYSLNTYDMYGESVPMLSYVADALYRKQKKGDVENFEDMVFCALAKNLANRYDKALHYSLEVYKHMLFCEENNTATFKLNRELLFEIIKNNVVNNIKFYTYSSNGRTPFIFYLCACFVEIHRITGEWVIPEDELQNLISS